MGFGTIRSTALTTDAAIRCFGDRIQVDRYRDDVTMETLCRMLFGPRLKDGEKITVRVHPFFRDESDTQLKEEVHEFASEPDGTLYICGLFCRKEDSGRWKTGMSKALSKAGLYPMRDIMEKFEDCHKAALFYTNTPPNAKTPLSPFDNTKSFIIVENLGPSSYSIICLLLKRLLGKWFSEQPLTEHEIEGYQKALQEKTPDKFLAAAAAYAERLDLRGMFIRKYLKNFETKFAEERIAALQQDAQRLDRQMDDYEREIGKCLRQKDDILAQLFGYQMNGTQDEPATMNFFLTNKNLILVGCTSSEIEFYDHGWLDQFDPEKAKATFGRDHMSAWLEHNQQFDVPDQDAKLLYKALFLDDKVKVRLWSHFTLRLRADSILLTHANSLKPDEIMHALPNPHHHYNSCPGQNRGLIEEAVRRRDIVGAIAQCMTATKGVNLTEQASYVHLSRDLFDPASGEVVYVNALGRFMTTKDAIAWLKKNA